jgi:hypothetical protein
MAIEYKWQFSSLEVTFVVGELQNVLSTVHGDLLQLTINTRHHLTDP